MAKVNTLPNTYTPALPKQVVVSVLNRLSKSSTLALLSLWPQSKHTQPPKPAGISQSQYNRQVQDEAKSLRDKKAKKMAVIDAILYKFWPSGLNLLQLAQIDCQLIADNNNSHLWVSSTAHDAWGHESPVSLDPQTFLHRLAAQLSSLFVSHIYVCTHPTFPLVLIRIQVFDLAPPAAKRATARPLNGSRRQNPAQPQVSSYKPYFLAVPMNSPHLIHSPGSDLVAQAVLQVVEACLTHSPANPIHLVTSQDQKPVKSLRSMHILKGTSRFAHSLGAWAPYADNTVDISPLADFSGHAAVSEVTKSPETYDSPEEKLQKLANVRFKGSADGLLHSDAPFDHPNPPKRRKTDNDATKSKYVSLTPMRYAEFELKEPLPGSSESSNVVIKLVGTDVFAGLHELAATITNPAKQVVNPETMPGWLTGEEGQSCGSVSNGVFSSK